jgi:dTDP-glucose pyrophosphorylase
MTGFDTFTPAIVPACKLVQPSNRGEYEISDAIDLLLQSGRTIDAIRTDEDVIEQSAYLASPHNELRSIQGVY